MSGTKPEYMTESWFALLQSRVQVQPRVQIAKQLGISAPALSQVLNGSGEYGKGRASTARIASRVEHTFGRYPCPHLTAEAGGDEQVVSADECRAFAHIAPPTCSPRAMHHWQACLTCQHKAASAPAVVVDARPRKLIPVIPTEVVHEGS